MSVVEPTFIAEDTPMEITEPIKSQSPVKLIKPTITSDSIKEALSSAKKKEPIKIQKNQKLKKKAVKVSESESEFDFSSEISEEVIVKRNSTAR